MRRDELEQFVDAELPRLLGYARVLTGNDHDLPRPDAAWFCSWWPVDTQSGDETYDASLPARRGAPGRGRMIRPREPVLVGRWVVE